MVHKIPETWAYVTSRHDLQVYECCWCGHCIAAKNLELLRKAMEVHDQFCKNKRLSMTA